LQISASVMLLQPTWKMNQEANVSGPILCLDLGRKRVGVAISDPTLIAITAVQRLLRSNWKQLLRDIKELIQTFDAQTVVIGFPQRLDGSEGSAAAEARDLAEKLARSIDLPVFLQDERLTSAAAEERLKGQGYARDEIVARVDSEAAAIILNDFISGGQQRRPVSRP